MPKSSQEQIDNDDKKIIAEIRKNSKESIDKIAKKCGFSRQKVWRTIKRLEKNKTIWGYCAVVDDHELEQDRYFLLIKRTSKPIDIEKLQLVFSRVLKKRAQERGVCIECSHYVHGIYDWVICIKAPDIKNVKKYVESLNDLAKEGYVSDIQVLQSIFPIEKNGILNPRIEEFKEFF